MNINYTWEITHFHLTPSANGKNNVVKKIAFTCHGEYVDGNGQSFKDEWTGATLVEFDANEPFIELDQITQEIAERFVFISENKKQRNIDWIKNKVKSRIEERVNPKVLVVEPPFLQK